MFYCCCSQAIGVLIFLPNDVSASHGKDEIQTRQQLTIHISDIIQQLCHINSLPYDSKLYSQHSNGIQFNVDNHIENKLDTSEPSLESAEILSRSIRSANPYKRRRRGRGSRRRRGRGSRRRSYRRSHSRLRGAYGFGFGISSPFGGGYNLGPGIGY